MSQPVLALGIAAVSVSGCVWYLPALADVRAGADRPRSRRPAALACLTGWGTVALLVPLALLASPWPAVAAVAATGTVLTVALALGARHRRSREQREASAQWAALRRQLGTPPPRRTARALMTGLTGGLLALSVAASGALLAGVPAPTVLVGAAVLVVATLALAAACARPPAHGTRHDGGRHDGGRP
ncbi:hypothetical protein [Streptomyces sp. NRRL F-5053]|uniref:hypothetical protein n=1 Tax=Streptomyces sp. NRRL F-5053 TaxID=1463854 RepID=UPI0004C66192|nr:hypothetical protein [Streptomyces sp. NRRL F-5053]